MGTLGEVFIVLPTLNYFLTFSNMVHKCHIYSSLLQCEKKNRAWVSLLWLSDHGVSFEVVGVTFYPKYLVTFASLICLLCILVRARWGVLGKVLWAAYAKAGPAPGIPLGAVRNRGSLGSTRNVSFSCKLPSTGQNPSRKGHLALSHALANSCCVCPASLC